MQNIPNQKAHSPFPVSDSPLAYFIVFLCVFLSLFLTKPTIFSGFVLLIIIIAAWLIVLQPPLRILKRAFSLSIAMFLPFFLFLPFSKPPQVASHPWFLFDFYPAIAPLFSVIVKGIAGVVIGVTAFTTLNPRQIDSIMHSLPLPDFMKLIFMQILHQSRSLFNETQKLIRVFKVRGASDGRYLKRLRVISSFPIVWMARIILRAEQSSKIMEFRGIGERMPPMEKQTFTVKDKIKIMLALCLIILTLLARRF